jgi:hypothetical protein
MIKKWENGEITSEPLLIIAADDPVSCALYALDSPMDFWNVMDGSASRVLPIDNRS